MRELVSLWRHRGVLASVARQDLRRHHLGTAAAIAWAILTPLVPLALLTIVFSLGLRWPLGGAPYVFGFAAAYVPWVLLAGALSGSTGALLTHRQLVKRVRFPIEILPADAILVQSLPHAVLLAATAIACLAAGYGDAAHLPLVLYFYVCAIALALGAGLLLASVAVILPGVTQAVPSVLNVAFWLTPIAWAASQLPPAGRAWLVLNPASYVVSGYRYALMPDVFPAPGAGDTAVFWAIAATIFVAGTLTFRRLRPHFWACL
jgi:ABC-type polysaccharide/polyol phosphate export permease